MLLKNRFRKYLPVVVDLETGGFDPILNPILEIALNFIDIKDNRFVLGESIRYHLEPPNDLLLNKEALEFTKIDLNHPLRNAIPTDQALKNIVKIVNKKKSDNECSRAILVGHNAHFDLSFLQANLSRYQISNSPFHPFSVIDTVSLGAAFTGQTVLARIAKELNIPYDNALAHSASYDAEITAQIFCLIMNKIDSN
ncbi:MAG: exonuclease domain-containing protein [Gammaproteobacteria bacterium]